MVLATRSSPSKDYDSTPYGARTIFISPGSNDPDCYAPTHLPTRVTTASGPAPYAINDVGFQGRPHDDVNDADRLAVDPVMRQRVGGRAD